MEEISLSMHSSRAEITKTNGGLFRKYQLQQDKHIDNYMLLGRLNDQDPAQWNNADVHAICVDPQLQEAEDAAT